MRQTTICRDTLQTMTYLGLEEEYETPKRRLLPAGAWYSQNHPLVMALAQENATMAWAEWVANSLFHSARLWPTYWPGIWSAADAYGSSLAKAGAEGISYL
jgi:hypothetical protein